MKPSPYFKDSFKYFFKRFSKKESLFKWFLTQAGEDSGIFDFPAALKGNPKTLIFMDHDVGKSTAFLKAMPDVFFKNALLCAHESLHAIISAKRASAIYYSDLECRYGEPVFEELEQKIRDAFDEKIRRMYQSEMDTATEKYQAKVDEINDRAARADIHTALIVNGVIEIRRG